MFFLCFTLCLSGCARLTAPTVAPEMTELQKADNLFNQKKYSEAENTYRKILKASPAPAFADAASAQYEIAFILAYYDNPQRNYPEAIRELDEFLRLYSKDSDRLPEAQNLRFILKALLDSKKENEHLSKSIEQLKKLDIRHEERRGGK
jgi:outer membrane protein assembly factor BamD (BamD/ComL family)